MSDAGDYTVGIDAGGTNVKAAVVGGARELRLRRAVEGRPLPEAVSGVLQEIELTLGSRVSRVGVAAPGIAAPDGRAIWWMQGRVAEVQGFDWTAHLGRGPRVPVLNDAQAALLGEVAQGAAKGLSNVVLLTLGTGVGGAAIVDGRLLRGHLGRAGHLGHICLDVRGERDIFNTPGSLEQAIGELTLPQRSGGRFKSTAELLAAHDDDDARRTWEESIRALACGLASIINVLDPEVVILGGGMVAAGERLFDPLRQQMESIEWRPHGRAVKIVPAAAGEFAGALGAAYEAMRSQ